MVDMLKPKDNMLSELKKGLAHTICIKYFFMKKFVLLIFLTIFFVFPVFADPPQRFEAFFQETQIDFGYTNGKFISIDNDYSQIGLFAPLSLSNGYDWV